MSIKTWRQIRYEDAKKAYAAFIALYPFTLENLDGEIWLPIPNYENYHCSNFGRVKSFRFGKAKIMTPQTDLNGYLQIMLCKNGKRKWHKIHRLVAFTFIPNPDNKPQVDHVFGMKFDNYVGNLQWVTGAENKKRAYTTGLTTAPQGEARHDSKLTNEQVKWCRKVYVPDDPQFGANALAHQLGVTPMTITLAVRGKTYQNAGGPIHEAFSRRVPDELRNEIRRLYKFRDPNFNMRALAQKFSLSLITISRILKE